MGREGGVQSLAVWRSTTYRNYFADLAAPGCAPFRLARRVPGGAATMSNFWVPAFPEIVIFACPSNSEL